MRWIFFFVFCTLFSSAVAHSPWSFEIGGQYTWMNFTTPPTFSGSTGGAFGKITRQAPSSLFGEVRSTFNAGTLTDPFEATSGDWEWYTEVVSGYSFPQVQKWCFTPYIGVGFDYLWDHKNATAAWPPIDLDYRVYYAIGGIDLSYTECNWKIGLQVDCLPTFNQTAHISIFQGSNWQLKERVGVAARLPIGCRIRNKLWLEIIPYYRLLPVGGSISLGLPDRTLNQFGGFLALRYFI